MLNSCPHCQGELGDLYDVMDVLAQDKMHGELVFQAKCCSKDIRAFSSVMQYYIEVPGVTEKPQMIGAA